MNWYNDNEPFAAQWLRNLIAAAHIGEGTVDERSINDVRPQELAGFTRCHFFAGIAGWELALNLAGWPSDAVVWTGSCPCQPLSCAGKHLGEWDARHLWPVWYALIEKCRPPTIFGEQVASKDGREWLAGVRADLDAIGYAVGAADLPACSVGAPHRRQRLFWVANAGHAAERDEDGGMGNTAPDGCEVRSRLHEEYDREGSGKGCGNSILGDPISTGLEGHGRDVDNRDRPERRDEEPCRPASQTGFWDNYSIVWCRDPKGGPDIPRRTQPGVFPLAPRLPGRVGQLKAYGNSIVPQVAAKFVKTFIEGKHVQP